MKNRFKFRFWFKDTQEMIYSEKFNDVQTLGQWLFGDRKDVVKMQCTGLKDKNGKLIYEGDIVKQGDIKYVVNWLEGTFCFLELETSYNFTIEYVMPSKQKVIGNIYENKELLNEI